MTAIPAPNPTGGTRTLTQWEALARKHSGQAVADSELAEPDRPVTAPPPPPAPVFHHEEGEA